MKNKSYKIAIKCSGQMEVLDKALQVKGNKVHLLIVSKYSYTCHTYSVQPHSPKTHSSLYRDIQFTMNQPALIHSKQLNATHTPVPTYSKQSQSTYSLKPHSHIKDTFLMLQMATHLYIYQNLFPQSLHSHLPSHSLTKLSHTLLGHSPLLYIATYLFTLDSHPLYIVTPFTQHSLFTHALQM